MQLYQTYLYTTTWYTGPGILLSKQVWADNVIYELIANTPVDMWYLVVNDGIREWAQFRTAFSTSEAGAAADARFAEITNCESTIMGARAVRGQPPTGE